MLRMLFWKLHRESLNTDCTLPARGWRDVPGIAGTIGGVVQWPVDACAAMQCTLIKGSWLASCSPGE